MPDQTNDTKHVGDKSDRLGGGTMAERGETQPASRSDGGEGESGGGNAGDANWSEQITLPKLEAIQQRVEAAEKTS